MKKSCARLIGSFAALAATAVLVPVAAHADGTKDPRWATPGATQQCNESTQSGGQGVTNTRHELGRRGPTSFLLNYNTLKQPDTITVFYEGRQIDTTGPVGDNLVPGSGLGSRTVVVPAGRASYVDVRVVGPEQGTEWSYTVHCPN
jgi:hypothetical protein